MKKNYACLPDGFDFDTAEGETVSLASLASAEGYYDNSTKSFIFDAMGEDQTDPQVNVMLNLDTTQYTAVAVKFERLEGTANAMQVYFETSSNTGLSEDKSMTLSYIDCGVDADGNYIAYFDFASSEASSSWVDTLTKIRLDPGNGNGRWSVKGIKIIKG